jgi:hypothetical protein
MDSGADVADIIGKYACHNDTPINANAIFFNMNLQPLSLARR